MSKSTMSINNSNLGGINNATSPSSPTDIGDLDSFCGHDKEVVRELGIRMEKQVNLSNSEDDDDHQLYKHLLYGDTSQVRDKSVEQLQGRRRFDIIDRLPYDIVINILEYIELKERLPLLNISGAWHDKLCACSSAWSKIIIDSKYDFSINELSLLSHISYHTLDLYLIKLKDTFLIGEIFSQIIHAEFIHLKSLKLDECNVDKLDKLFNVLSHTSATLKELSIQHSWSSEDINPAIPFKTVLSTCRNLESFGYRDLAKENIVGELAGNLNSDYHLTTRLTKLTLRLGRVDASDLSQILSACSYQYGQLRHLFVSVCEPTCIGISAVQDYCKNLETLSFNTTFFDEEIYNGNDDNVHDISNNKSEQQIVPMSTTELRQAALSVEQPQKYASFLIHHSTTIQSLKLDAMHLSFEDNHSDYGGSSPLHTIPSLNALRSLVIYHKNAEEVLSDSAVSALIKKSPNLRWLHFNSCMIWGKQIIRAIADLHRLQKIDMWGCFIDEKDITTLFDTIVSKGEQNSSLEKVIFMAASGCDLNAVVERLPDIVTLQHVVLSQIQNGPQESSMIKFCKKLQSHLHIRVISIDSMFCMNNEILEHLARIKNLKRLELEELYGITQDGLRAFDNTPVELTIEYCPRCISSY